MQELLITVTSLDKQPSFSMPAGSTPALVRKAVASKFGYQSIGVAHCWHGILRTSD